MAVSHPQKVTEALDIMIAGADTTSSTLTAGVLHILSDEKVQNKLIQALQAVLPNDQGNLPLLELEKIDYLVYPLDRRYCVFS